ncbi:MAG: AraC family transcriptional regulator ligand-binding domain-containing protein [Polyangiaceae bacterium]
MTARRTQRPTLPGGYAREIVELCARFGVKKERLAEGLDPPLATLTDPSTRVELPEFLRLVRRAEELTGEPGLAFYLGLHMRASWHGFLGFAAMTAGTLEEALDLAERFGRTRVDAVSLVTRRDGDFVAISIREHAPLGELREFFVTALFIGLALIGETLIGRPLEGGRIEMSHAEPPYFRKFAAAVPRLAAVTFGNPDDRAIVPASALGLRIGTADPAAMELARQQCERELAALGEGAPVVSRIRALLRDDLTITLPEAAKRTSMSERTLKRRLAEQGTAYSEIVDDARRQRALLLIEDRRLTLDAIAAQLGYSDTANFTRAFKRWTGKTPGEARDRRG